MSSPQEYFRDGFFPTREESEADFALRVKNTLEGAEQLKANNPHLPQEKAMKEEKLAALGQACQERFGTCPAWVPAYCSQKDLPALTGGMAVYDEKEGKPLIFFQLRKVFQRQDKWLIYTSHEIVSHEMVHVCRFPLNSIRYEETLAYSISSSGFRRWMGGALLTPRDNTILLASLICWFSVDLLLIFGTALPGAVALVLRALFPLVVVLGLIRNLFIHGELQKAKVHLKKLLGPSADALLFCLDDEEIQTLSNLEDSSVVERWWTQLEGYRGSFLRELFPLNPPPT